MFKLFLFFFLSVNFLTFGRTWVDSNGSKMEAEIIKLEGDQVLLKKPNGKTFKIPYKNLSKNDQAFVNNFIKSRLILSEKQLKDVYGVYLGITATEFLKLHGGTTARDKFDYRNWILPKKAKIQTSFLSVVCKNLSKEKAYDLAEIEYKKGETFDNKIILKHLEKLYGRFYKTKSVTDHLNKDLKVHYRIWSRGGTRASIEFISWDSGKCTIKFFTDKIYQKQVKEWYTKK